ncbi:PulJ/GspJ family protein [Hydrogenophaga aromaticivorans]|uniref:PulJ/GspJ family protein n=1 Tax=Hydrogenophaga aromaticivorans TaxID=2610898 RepID=UPI001C4325F1
MKHPRRASRDPQGSGTGRPAKPARRCPGLDRFVRRGSSRYQHRGFTLIELLVALAVMGVLALLSWRSLDGMNRAQEITQQRADEVLRLQAALGQWGADLDALVETGELGALDFDGRVLRLTRRDSTENALQSPGIRVVAWARKDPAAGGTGGPQWMRWQSPPLRRRDELAQAWARASQWGLGEQQRDGAGTNDTALALIGIDRWQLFYHRGATWGNPLSSIGNEGRGVAGVSLLPNGVRLVLELSAGQGLSGTLVRDWVRPTLAAGSP